MAISLVCAGLFVFNRSVKSDTAITLAPISGIDNSASAMRAFTPTEIGKLSVSDNARIQSDGNWSMTGAYDESKYLEFVFAPNISATASISSVTVTHEYYRTNALVAAKLEIWDGVGWHDVPLLLPHTSGTAGEILETKDLTSFIGTSASLNGIKIRFLAYRNDVVQSGIKTSHDLIQLGIDYILPSATPTPSISDSDTPIISPAPSDTATPLATDASSSFVPTPIPNTPEPTPFATDTPIFTSPFTPTPTPFVYFTPDPETTPNPDDLTASVSMPLIASIALKSPSPSPTASPSSSPTPEAIPSVSFEPTPNPFIAMIAPSKVIHYRKKPTPVSSPSLTPLSKPSSRIHRISMRVVNIWHLFTHYLNMIGR